MASFTTILVGLVGAVIAFRGHQPPLYYVLGSLLAITAIFGFANLVFAGARFKPEKGIPYLVCSFLPGTVRRVLLGIEEPQERKGSLLLNIHETSSAAAMQMLSDLMSHFESGQTLSFEGQTVDLDLAEASKDRGNLLHTDIALRIGWRSYF